MKQIEDISGKTFGNWTVLKLSHVSDCGSVYWECRCSCGNIVLVQSGHMKSGKSTKCKQCSNREKAEASKKNDVDIAIRMLHTRYKLCAERRNISFMLEKDFFGLLTQQTCYYCGSPPSNMFKFKRRAGGDNIIMYNGIDRIDSTKGYSKENCVTCCFQCNRSKNNLTKKQFLDWITIVYNKQILLKEFVKNENSPVN